jgi:TolA-binding protein
MSFVCDICCHKFQNKSNLSKHQKTAKFCLNLRSKDYRCLECKKEFISEESLNKHILKYEEHFITKKSDYELELKKTKSDYELELQKIKSRYETKLKNTVTGYKLTLKKQNLEHRIQIDTLEDKIEKMRKEIQTILENRLNKQDEIIKDMSAIPRTTNISSNNNCNNKYNINTPLVLDDDKIKEKVETNLTLNHCMNGQNGIADFTYQNFLLDNDGNPMYLCTDTSRGNFVYKDTNGNYQRDHKAKNLIEKIAPPIIKKSKVLLIDNHKYLINEEPYIDDDEVSTTETECEDRIQKSLDKEGDYELISQMYKEVKNINQSDNNTFVNRLAYKSSTNKS